jgi:cell division protease FtsH
MLKDSTKPFVNSNDPKSSIIATDTTFDDFYGGDEIKEKFAEIIDFLKQPDKYERMGARIRRGVMFYGPPGTGKTMLARALANEAGCQFIKVVASEFQEMFAGVGAKRVRELFNVARKAEGGCIIFVDEIDALGSRLNHLRDSHETTTTINQFLSEMDGFSPSAKVVIVAATNRIDLVDSAILRSGRFDIKMHIALPNAVERAGILKKVLNKKAPNLYEIEDEMITLIGEHSEGWCGADL